MGGAVVIDEVGAGGAGAIDEVRVGGAQCDDVEVDLVVACYCLLPMA